MKNPHRAREKLKKNTQRNWEGLESVSQQSKGEVEKESLPGARKEFKRIHDRGEAGKKIPHRARKEFEKNHRGVGEEPGKESFAKWGFVKSPQRQGGN